MARMSNEDLLNKYINEIRLINSPNPRVDFDKHIIKADKYKEEILRRMEGKNK